MANRADDMATLMLTSGASGRINALLSLRVLRSLWRLVGAFFLFFLLPFRGRPRRCAESPEKIGGGGREEKTAAAAGGGKVVRVPAAMVPRRSVVDKDVAARRALAIKRVVEDNINNKINRNAAANDGGENCNKDNLRDYSLFFTSRGDTLFTQSWTPAKVQVRGVVVLLHGLNEHSGRYNDFAKKLNANGFKVYGLDWIGMDYKTGPEADNSKGHGGSDGLHAYVHSLDYAVSDLKLFLDKVVAENPALPCFCFGHSTGGAIVLKATLDPKVQQRVAGIVLTSPAVAVQPSHPIIAVLAPVFSLLLPRYQFRAANKEGTVVSRDPQALVAKYSDPLVFTGSIRVRTGYEILRITTYLQQNLSRVNVPFFVLHGTDDSVTDPGGSRRLYEKASSADKTIELCRGLLHDLLFEPEKEEVGDKIVAWFKDRW